MSPFNADLLQASYADPYVRTCDVYCAITGRQWAEVIQYGPFAHWRHKVRQVDLAVDRTDYPFVKHEFNPRGRRRVLYIGRTSWNKNPEFLEEVARAVPEMEFGWVGGGARRLAGFRRHGTMPSYGDAMRRLVGSYDVFVTLGRADANPTTVLEAMAWGLVPVITDTSGYKDEPGVITVPTEDVSAARQALQTLNWCDAADLHAMQRANLTRLDRHFTWARFVSDIAQAVEDPTPGAVVQAPAWRVRVLFSTASLVSPHILDRERLVTHAKRVLARRERGTGTAWTVPEDARPPVVGATS